MSVKVESFGYMPDGREAKIIFRFKYGQGFIHKNREQERNVRNNAIKTQLNIMKTLLFLISFILLTTYSSTGQSDTSKNRINMTDYIFYPQINESDSLNNLFVFLDSVLIYKENGKMFDNAVVIINNFPINWIKNKDIDTLIHILKSKRKCKCAFNIVYSGVPLGYDYSELGGYVIEFINSFRQKRQVDFGLYSCPRIDEGKVDEILNWWKETKKQQ